MALKYLATGRIQGTTAERTAMTTEETAVLSGTITSFVFDISWYRGSSDTSGTSNQDSNRVFLSSNTAGYTQSGQTSTDRQIGYMLSSGNTNGIVNWGSSGSSWATGSPSGVQDASEWQYYRMILDDSANTVTWKRYDSDSDRTNDNNSQASGTNASFSTNFDTGKDLKYLTVTALDNGGSATDFKLDDIKFWKNTETPVGDPDVHITLADGTGWTALSGKGSVTGGELVMTGDSSTPAVYTIPDTPAVYPNIPNGTIFEDSSDGKHYMWDGTSAWNEMV